MKIYPVFGFLGALTFSSLIAADDSTPMTHLQSVDAIGEAYDLQTQEKLYSEYHDYQGEQHRVIYLDPEGDIIADKQIDYSNGLATPNFTKVIRGSDQVAIDWKNEKISITKNPGKQKIIKAKTPLVIDAGFDHYVRQNWDKLIAGEKLSFYFPLPNRQTLAKLQIAKSTCTYTSSDQCFELNVSNWLLKMLIAPIELGYQPQTQKLMRYRGLSNISDEQGNGFVVDIHYRYGGDALALMTEPL